MDTDIVRQLRELPMLIYENVSDIPFIESLCQNS